MGDRGQVLMKPSGVYLYTHWGGYHLIKDVFTAINKGWRWDQDDYLCRIIFDEMKRKGDDQPPEWSHGPPHAMTDMGETGFGIGTIEHADAYITVVVDVEKQAVTLMDYDKAYASYEFKDLAGLKVSDEGVIEKVDA